MHNDTDFLDKMAFLASSSQTLGEQSALESASLRGASQGGLQEVRIQLNDARLTNGYQVDTRGCFLYFSKLNSSPNAVFCLSLKGSQIQFFAPGAYIEGNFESFVLTRTVATEQTSPNQGAGEAVFYISQNPSLKYGEMLGIEALSRPGELGPMLARSTPSAAGTVSAGANAPTLSTDGLPCNGMRGARVFVRNTTSNVITAGSVNWWFFNDLPAPILSGSSPFWSLFRNDVFPVALNATGYVAQIDFTGVRANRVAAEPVGLAAGAGVFRGDLEVF